MQFCMLSSHSFINLNINLISNFQALYLTKLIPNLKYTISYLSSFFIDSRVKDLQFLWILRSQKSLNPTLIFRLTSSLRMKYSIFKENFIVLYICYLCGQTEKISVFKIRRYKKLWLHSGIIMYNVKDFGKRFLNFNQHYISLDNKNQKIGNYSDVDQFLCYHCFDNHMEKIAKILVAITCFQIYASCKQQLRVVLFVPDIRDNYSIASEIYNQMKNEEIEKNRPVRKKDYPIIPAPIPPFSQTLNQPHSITLPTNDKPMPITTNSFTFKKTKHQEQALNIKKYIEFNPIQKIPLKVQKVYALYKINQNKVIQENGQVKKVEPELITNLGIDSKQLQAGPTQNIDIKSLITKDNKQSSEKSVQGQTSIASLRDRLKVVPKNSQNKNIRESENIIENGTEDNKDVENQIINFFFSILFGITMLLIVFGVKPQDKKQGALQIVDQERDALN